MRGDAQAGFTVGLMMIPQSMAYASLAGMPVLTGIHAAILPAMVAALFSASPRLSVGPTALTCLLVAASLEGLAERGSATWISLAICLSLLSGIFQVALGALRFGWLLNLVSSPVLTAFTQAAALLIIGSQVPALLGLGDDPANRWSLAALHGPSAAFGLGSVALLMLARRWRPGFPVVLVLLLATAGLSSLTGFEAAGGRVIGTVPASLPEFGLPSFPGFAVLGHLLLPSLTITLVSFLETASSARIESERAGRAWDQDQDLIGQGLGKIAAGLSGSFPTSASFSRSALNLYAGAQTGWSSMAAAATVLLVLLFMTPALGAAPQPVLAAIVIAAVLGSIRPSDFVRILRISRAEAMIAAASFAITLISAPRLYWGVLAGVTMALSHFLHQRLHPRIIEVGLHPDGSLRDRHLWHLPPLGPDLYALRMDAALDFASANRFERAITDRLLAGPEIHTVCLFAQPINRIDATGAETFLRLAMRLRARGVALHVSGIKLPAEGALRGAGVLDPSLGIRFHRTDAELLQHLPAAHDGGPAALPPSDEAR